MRSRFEPCLRAARSHALVLLAMFIAISAGWSAEPAAEKKFFDSNGVRIHYIDEGQGEPILLIHGFSANIKMQWSPVLPALEREFRVIALDNRGHGESDKPHDAAAYGAEMAEDSIRLLDYLGLKKVQVAGYSMGGFITMALLTKHPERFQSAVVAGAGWARPEDPRIVQVQELADSLDKGEGFGPLLNALTPAGQPTPGPEQVKSMSAMMASINDIKALAAVARGMGGLMVTEASLKANKIPTLLMAGCIDPLKANADALVGVMPNIETVFIDGADHMTAFRRPEFQAALLDFFRKHRMNPEAAPAPAPQPAAAGAAR